MIKLAGLCCAACLISGCTAPNASLLHNTKKNDLFANIENQLDTVKESSVERTEAIDGLKVTLHKVIFEANGVLLDYTVQQERNTESNNILVQVNIPGQETTTVTAYELASETDKKASEKHVAALCVGEEEKFLTASDKGQTAVVEFLKLPETADYMGDTDELEGIRIELEIPQIAEAEIIPLKQTLSYDEGEIGLEQLERHACYDLLKISGGVNEFMSNFYAVERTDAEGVKSKILTMYSIGEDYFMVYEPMALQTKQMKLQAVKAVKDGNWQTAGEVTEIILQ